MKRHSIIYISLLLALLLCLTGCSEQKVTKQIFAMDTYMELSAYGKNAEVGLGDVISTINQYALALDPEVESSAVYALNHADGAEVILDPAIVDMLATANRSGSRQTGLWI